MGLGDFQASEPGERMRQAFGDGVLEDLVRTRSYRHLAGLMSGLSGGLVTSREIERALVRRFFPPDNVRVYAGRTKVDLEMMKVRSGERLDLEGLSQLLGQGVTVVINQIERCFPSLSDFAFDLTRWLGEEIEVVGVLSFGDRSGIAEHHDEQHIFIAQIEGAKVWQMTSEAAGESACTVTMQAGDVMFVPTGQRHHCTAQGLSFHIGVLILAKRASDLMPDFGKRLGKDPLLNTPLLGIMGAEEEADLIARYRARMHQMVDDLDLAGELSARRAADRLNDAFAFPPASKFEKPRDS